MLSPKMNGTAITHGGVDGRNGEREREYKSRGMGNRAVEHCLLDMM